MLINQECLLMVVNCSYIIQKQKDPSKAHQMKLETIIKALKWLEMDMDLDEVCYLFLSLAISFYAFFVVCHLARSLLIEIAVVAGGMYCGHINIQEPC